MKCSIDNKCPRAASHLKTKAKKNALMEDRFAQIETENRILLEKMSNIMRVSPLSRTDPAIPIHRKYVNLCLTNVRFIASQISIKEESIMRMKASNTLILWEKNEGSENFNVSRRKIKKFFDGFRMHAQPTITVNGKKTRKRMRIS